MTEATADRLGMIEDHLALADRHIATGEARISRQEAAIVEQARRGRDTAAATKVLHAMRRTLALMREHREIILCERERKGQAGG